MVGFENHIGKITISENYLTELVKHAVTDCFGVADVCSVSTFRSAVSALTAGKAFRKKLKSPENSHFSACTAWLVVLI